MATLAVLAGTLAEAQPSAELYPGWGVQQPAQAAPQIASGAYVAAPSLSALDSAQLRAAMDAGKRGDMATARTAMAQITDPTARKLALWSLVDARAESLSFYEVDQAVRDLQGWPRAARRRMAAEKLIETSGLTPRQVLDWFGRDEPVTAQGAMALASAQRASGRSHDAQKLIRAWWRGKSFEADTQRAMLTRFADMLSQEDHVRRADVLLYGQQGPAAREMIPLLPADQQAAALARIALRTEASDANAQVAALPASVAGESGVAFERAAFMRRKGLDSLALAQLASFPREIATPEQADRVWDERYRLVLSSLRNGDARSAYLAAADTGLKEGSDATEAEFYAGWIALTKLQDPNRAERHFAAIERIGTSPITRGRALYWLGRTAEAQRDPIAAQTFYAQAAQFPTVFYGQLAAERLGQPLNLGRDPQISAGHRARFEAREPVRAARLLYQMGQRDLYRLFVLALDDTLPTVEDQALLVDLARGYGDQDTSMRVVRAAAQRGFILPDRGYPTVTPPGVTGAPEPALVLGITRQESGFDPLVRSGVGARGMMQLMPATAASVARKMGVSYSAGLLDEPDYNMRLGSSFLGQLVGNFSGSYVMAIAGYNAGPGRPPQWASFCGDPRTSTADPLDFIECIPFSETRNYVMRVMEGMTVYRAKLAGGAAPITLSQDLRRGGYVYARPAGA
ncbi:lytic transglycosylase domain-containing protein [Phenylobacterium immobile]|uniref:lytic transglycosylase domain-containing protein n=1 Tax=Phenylobacterium immobile TaxID=21 RepID=UPI001FDF6EB8|nr:lytic transglycosylase domain-containing protein [Phenylobacterium immobile]